MIFFYIFVCHYFCLCSAVSVAPEGGNIFGVLSYNYLIWHFSFSSRLFCTIFKAGYCC